MSGPDSPLPIFDAALAARLTGDRPEVARELLRLLLAELPAHCRQLAEAWARADHDQLRQQVHRLLGSASYCATPALTAAARGLHTALARADAAAITQAYPELLEEIARLQAADLP